MIEALSDIRDVEMLVEHVEYAMGERGKPRRFSPRVHEYISSFLKSHSLDALLREISLATLPEDVSGLLEGLDMREFSVFPADVEPGIVYKLSASAHPYSLTPLHRLLKKAGRVKPSDKCLVILPGVIDIELPKKAKVKMGVYRQRLLDSCAEVVFLGGISDEKYLFRTERKVKTARSVGSRKSGTYKFLVWLSNDGNIDPYSVPALLSGGVLAELARHWKPFARNYEIVKYAPPKNGVKARIIGVANVEDGKVAGEMKERVVNEKTILGRGDVVVALKARRLRVGVIEIEGTFAVDPNVVGIRISDVEEARSVVEYMLLPVIKRAIEENICQSHVVPFLPVGVVSSLPIPPDPKRFEGEIAKIMREYEEELRKAERRMEEKLLELARSLVF